MSPYTIVVVVAEQAQAPLANLAGKRATRSSHHIVRQMTGASHRANVPGSGLGGSSIPMTHFVPCMTWAKNYRLSQPR
jgi:hypothetical protein